MPKLGFRKRAGRVVRRVVRKGVKYAKRRYVSKKGNFKLGRLVKDVAMVKKLINVEKKRFFHNFTGVIGQVNGNGGGAALIDITPGIIQGLTASQRNGNSVKITGIYLQGQFLQQVNTLDSNMFSVELWCHKAREVPMSLATTGDQLYASSPFSNQIDMVSRRNQDYFSDYVMLRRKTVYVKGDTYSSNIFRNATFNMGVKLNRHLRWDDGGTLINGQYFLLIRSKNGNCSSTVASSANIPHTGVNTGYTYGLNIIHYYVDN